MAKIYKNILELVGNTPLLEVTSIYGYQSGCPNSCAGSLGMRCISRDRMRKSFSMNLGASRLQMR